MVDQIIDLEKEGADERLKKLLNLKKCSYKEILKFKFLYLSLKEIIAHFIALAIILPYIYLLVTEPDKISSVYDTIAKVVVGAYIMSYVKE